MARASALLVALAGVGVGAVLNHLPVTTAKAGSCDRFQDFVMCTGAAAINSRLQTDGVWLLDYKSGKLLGTCVDKTQGKIVGWAEVDLAAEFSVQPLQDVHFMMTTGYISQGQSALYVAETTTGKFGVYTMGAADGGGGIVIRRHDMTSFRVVQPNVQPASATVPGMPGVPASVVPGRPVTVPTPGVNPPQPNAPIVPPGQPSVNTVPQVPAPLPGLGTPVVPR